MSPAEAVSIELDKNKGNTSIVIWDNTPFDVFDPSTWVFDIDVIGKSLSNICRFGGHVNFYSVAEHSVRVADWLRKEGASTRVVLMGLLHDATEAFIGDITRPLKHTLQFKEGGESVIDFEDSLNISIMNAFDLFVDSSWEEDWALVKEADYAVYKMERSERPSPGGSLTPVQALDMFQGMFHSLWRDFQLKVG
jgi:hypothetical protein